LDLLRARDAVAELLAELPGQIHDMLEHVTCQVLVCPPHGVLADAKGLFFGQQQQGGPEDPAAVVLARGAIQVYAANLDSAEQAQQAVLHEIGHALGEDEWAVAELGLST
jgi:predicted Zn-dependent protease with MMP-like domain